MEQSFKLHNSIDNLNLFESNIRKSKIFVLYPFKNICYCLMKILKMFAIKLVNIPKMTYSKKCPRSPTSQTTF